MELILWRHADAAAGAPDGARELTGLGRSQATRIAAWLTPRLPQPFVILVSPARRAQQTAEALGLPYLTEARVGVDAMPPDVIDASGWPNREGTVIVVGHQPTIGRVAALLLTGRQSDWPIAAGALWWLAYGERDGLAALRAAIAPELA